MVNLRVSEPDRSKRVPHLLALLGIAERPCVVRGVDGRAVPGHGRLLRPLEPVRAPSPLPQTDLKSIFAAQFASEIAAVTENGGDMLLRERVAALDEDQRRLLREALA